jgi:small GTP-binding protein
MQFTLNSLAKTLGKPINKDFVRRRKDCFAQSTYDRKKYISAISLPESSPVTTLVLNEEATHLEYLYANGVKTLQQVDFQLFENVEYIDLSNCNLVGDVVLRCTESHLKQIYLQNNKIESIRFIGNFPKLQLIDICKNQLKSIAFEGYFNHLHYLYLNDNQLVTIDLSNLKALKTLHLEDNQFRILARNFIQTSIETLRLANNPLPSAIRGFVQNYDTNCLKEVRQYFADLDKGSRLDNEHKVLLLGNGNVGKSCLVERLIYNTFQTNWHSTHGIVLEQFPHQPYLFNLWDFGGQDIYHATHRLFLQSNALYLILWDLQTEKSDFTCCEEDGQLRKYENHKLNYWLHYVKNQGKGSPVIVIQTKSESASLSEAAACTAKIAHYNEHFKLSFEAIDSKVNDWDSNGYNHLLSTMRASAQANLAAVKCPKIDISCVKPYASCKKRVKKPFL